MFSLTLAELNKLYSDPSVAAYRPHAVLARLSDGHSVPALCYSLPNPPPSEANSEYAVKLRAVAEKVGLPRDGVQFPHERCRVLRVWLSLVSRREGRGKRAGECASADEHGAKIATPGDAGNPILATESERGQAVILNHLARRRLAGFARHAARAAMLRP